MKKNKLILILSMCFVVNVHAADAPTPTVTPTTSASLPKPTKYLSYYGYSYRAFEGLNPGKSPVFLEGGDMQLHVFALRYNINDQWAVRAGTAYLIHDLNFSLMGKPEDVHVEGFSDLRISAAHGLYKNEGHSLDMTIGFNVPTAPFLTDKPSGEPLPPQDQISSGTVDLMTTLTYAFSKDDWSFAEKLDSTVHMGENSIGYRLGDEFGATSSASYTIKPYFVPVLSARYTDRKPLGVNHMAHPQKADKYVGSGWEGALAVRSGIPVGNVKVGVEAGAPFYRSSNTTQYTIGQTLWFASANVMATF